MSESRFKQAEMGKIPVDWNVVLLKDACSKIGSGITPRGAEKVYKEKGVALIRSQNVLNNRFVSDGLVYIGKDIAKEMENVEVQKEDVLLNITGDSVARCCTVPENVLPARVNQHVSIIRTDKQRLNPIFLRYYLTSKKMQDHMLSLAQSGGTRNALTKGMIENFAVPRPDIREQEAIASTLLKFDLKMALNENMNKSLEAVGQAVFKRWFVDFEFPNEEGKPYKSSGGEMIYDEMLDKEIPAGWKVQPIDEIADFLNGLALQRFPARDGEQYLPVIKIRELRQGITESSDRANLDVPQEYIVNDGDILFSWSGSLEAVIWGFDKGALNQHLFKVTSSKYPKWFFYYWIIHFLPEYRQIAADKATTMGHIQRHHLTASQVTIPDGKTLGRMDKLLGPVLEKITKTKVEARILAEIRDLLLPKLMSGKIRVPVSKADAEAL
jgi:type I restriction enzyme S subunit